MSNFLALGDSYTIGEGVPEAQRWPMQLTVRLRETGISIESLRIIAQTGWTTDELSAAIDAAELHPPYELVSLLIGVNNQYRDYPIKSYEEEFSTLLDKALLLAGNRPDHVVVLSIPDWGITPFGERSGRNLAIGDRLKSAVQPTDVVARCSESSCTDLYTPVPVLRAPCHPIARDDFKRFPISQEIDRFNAINFSESQKKKVHYVDITPLTRQFGAQSEMLVEDGLHPSGAMYRLWVSRVFPIVEGIFAR